MAKPNQSGNTKRGLIDKANTRIVAATAIAAFVTVFCLVASKALFSQASYQNRVINAQRQADNQVKYDLSSINKLISSYNAFVSQSPNIIGGNPVTTANPNDGNNAKIVLDALPGNYDFPALATSLENMLTSQNVQVESLSGTDLGTQQNTSAPSAEPKPIAIPFSTTVSGSYGEIQNVISELERSIRPIQIQTLSATGSQSNLILTLTAQTYYQPQKALTVTTEVIK